MNLLTFCSPYGLNIKRIRPINFSFLGRAAKNLYNLFSCTLLFPFLHRLNNCYPNDRGVHRLAGGGHGAPQKFGSLRPVFFFLEHREKSGRKFLGIREDMPCRLPWTKACLPLLSCNRAHGSGRPRRLLNVRK